MSTFSRKIIHCDCDCFYASVEMRDNPDLRDVPLAVGGASDKRGVIATCNYKARSFGVRSAMPTAQALKLCPALVILPVSMAKYRQASEQIHEIYREYTDKIEPLSLDEAYLDVTNSPQYHGSATLIAQAIRQQIADTVGITASAGIAPNKFLAKIASDWHKPNGQFVITPNEIDAFLTTLPVAKIFGVGKVTAQKLASLGVETCVDLQTWSKLDLHQHFGKFGDRLYELCRGIDHREVIVERERKSVSIERTYAQDLPDLSACLTQIPYLHQELMQRIERTHSAQDIHKLFVKVRFNNFRHTTVECVDQVIHEETWQQLMKMAYDRGQLPVRLLGLGVRLQHVKQTQGELFEMDS